MISRGAGFLASAGVHGGLLLCALVVLGAPRSHDVPQEQPIIVDLVPPAEAPKPATPPATPAEKPQGSAESAQSGSATPQQQQSSPQPTAEDEQPPAQPAEQQQAALSDQLPVIDTSTLSTFNLRLPTSRFDSKADKQADLARSTIAEFRGQLKRCWRLPPGVAANSRARVVIRVFLSPTGALASEPVLIEAPASASMEGPAVMQAAMRALNQCQPFATLPRDRYKEWRVLDVGFSAREMAGS